MEIICVASSQCCQWVCDVGAVLECWLLTWRCISDDRLRIYLQLLRGRFRWLPMLNYGSAMYYHSREILFNGFWLILRILVKCWRIYLDRIDRQRRIAGLSTTTTFCWMDLMMDYHGIEWWVLECRFGHCIVVDSRLSDVLQSDCSVRVCVVNASVICSRCIHFTYWWRCLPLACTESCIVNICYATASCCY